MIDDLLDLVVLAGNAVFHNSGLILLDGKDPFCMNYASWRDNGFIVSENDLAYVIPSVTPSVPGHLVAVVKRHVAKRGELSGADHVAIVQASQTAVLEFSRRYVSHPDFLVGLYKQMIEKPIDGPARDFSIQRAKEMLEHPHLRVLLHPEDFNVGINNGKVAGQSMNHYHEQIIPRRGTDAAVLGVGVVTIFADSHHLNPALSAPAKKSLHECMDGVYLNAPVPSE